MNKILKYSIFVILIAIIALAITYYPRLNIITGFAAKNVCSCVFEAERDPESVRIEDNDFEPVSYSENEVNFNEKSATSTVFGLKSRKAVYTLGTGCTLLPEGVQWEEISTLQPNRTISTNNAPYPYGNGNPIDTIFDNVDQLALQTAVSSAFDRRGEKEKRTRAVLVLYKDHIIAEQYAPGFAADTQILGWSMTKSITSAVLGVLERQGKISTEQDHLFPEWLKDKRSGITLDDLLRMKSGLVWEEDYTRISDVTKMLFQEEDMSLLQREKPLAGAPGTIWNYSSGTSNTLSGFIRDQFPTHQEYLDFWYNELIDKIGMNSMVLETDVAGNYVGSSYSWATARDWAKFGLLYLNKGNWNGEQILNESWVEYTVTPTKGSNGEYGAHFWLNAGGKYPDVPRDLFSSNGFQGQHVFIIPSKDLVVVRFGLVEHPLFDVNTFLKEIIAAIE